MRDPRTVMFNSSSPPRIVDVQPILPVFVIGMELPAYWTCWTRRELNWRPKMHMRKAIPAAPSLAFFCTNRSLADGRKLFLRLREAENPETYALPLLTRLNGLSGCAITMWAGGVLSDGTENVRAGIAFLDDAA